MDHEFVRPSPGPALAGRSAKNRHVPTKQNLIEAVIVRHADRAMDASAEPGVEDCRRRSSTPSAFS
ncbi:MAG: hypothetical protein S0880_03910 [Actinomycetota bacterium]|nr:hypothetical protein [Actinomycetota bacterium]